VDREVIHMTSSSPFGSIGPEPASGPLDRHARLVWVDNLKVAVIAGVIVMHAATAYLTDLAGWYYEERTTSQLTSWLVGAPGAVGALFLLGPLFLLGGSFAAASVVRSTSRGFARRRLLRLGSPLLLFVVLLDPLSDYIGHRAQGLEPDLVAYVALDSPVRDVGPLWFVAALLVLSLTYAGWRAWAPVGAGSRSLGSGQLVAAAALIAVGSFVLRLRWPFTGDTFLDLRWPQWAQATVLFWVGVLLEERDRFGRIPAVWVRRAGQIAVANLAGMFLLGAVVVVSSGDHELLLGGWAWPSAVFALMEGATAVALSLWVVTWFQRRWTGQRRLFERASRGAYAAYVVHPIVLVSASAAARPLPWPPETKFVLVAAVGVAVSFAVGWTLTRSSLVGRIL
jgi:glucans biosynthesis protein C